MAHYSSSIKSIGDIEFPRSSYYAEKKIEKDDKLLGKAKPRHSRIGFKLRIAALPRDFLRNIVGDIIKVPLLLGWVKSNSNSFTDCRQRLELKQIQLRLSIKDSPIILFSLKVQPKLGPAPA